MIWDFASFPRWICFLKRLMCATVVSYRVSIQETVRFCRKSKRNDLNPSRTNRIHALYTRAYLRCFRYYKLSISALQRASETNPVFSFLCVIPLRYEQPKLSLSSMPILPIFLLPAILLLDVGIRCVRRPKTDIRIGRRSLLDMWEDSLSTGEGIGRPALGFVLIFLSALIFLLIVVAIWNSWPLNSN